MSKSACQLIWIVGIVAVAALCGAPGLEAAEPVAALPIAAPAKIGDKIGRLEFKDIRYVVRTLDDLEKGPAADQPRPKRAFVLVFTNTTCPVVQRYWPKLKSLEEAFAPQGAQFVAVNVGVDDSITDMAAQAVKYGVSFPFVKDFSGTCAAKVGAARTPEVVVLDAERRLRYRGRIDDQYRVSGNAPRVTTDDLRQALEQLLASREIAVAQTPVDGCLITRPASREPDPGITFVDHVAPLLAKHCQACHRPGTAAPFSLVTWEDAAAHAEMIAEVVTDRRMPPWNAAKEHGPFVNRRELTSIERATIVDWVRGKRAAGDTAKLPAPLPAPDAKTKWRIGPPDMVLTTLETHSLPAAGDVPYKYTVLPYLFTEDTWIQGAEILPDNPRVLHHCNMGYVAAGKDFAAESNFVTGQVPGGDPLWLRDNIGFLIPKGSVLGLQIHYTSTGQPERCRISVGLKFARETIQKRLKHVQISSHRFAIPPEAPAHPLSASRTLTADATGLALFSHMHLRGKDMTFLAHLPDGATETLLVVPNYSFDWQMPYVWEQGKRRFPKGTRLECVAHFDNSPFNPFNPNPAETVREGQETYREMMYGFVFFTDDHERLNLDVDPKTGRVKPPAK